jgi:hypothetical protein
VDAKTAAVVPEIAGERARMIEEAMVEERG